MPLILRDANTIAKATSSRATATYIAVPMKITPDKTSKSKYLLS